MKDVMTITPLGSGQEVGRSCHLLEFRGVSILLDCGIHPGYDSIHGLPYLDRLEPDQIDIVLISHFHLDHAASLPYFTERTNFKGRIFMTHPTKAVLRLLLGDYLRLLALRSGTSSSNRGGDAGDAMKQDDVLYTEAELLSCIDKIELIDYHQTVSLDIPMRKAGSSTISRTGGSTDAAGAGDTSGGVTSNSSGTMSVKFHALNAGHVLGAAMFVIEIGGRTVLYTGDYSAEEDRHLMAAELPTTTRGFVGSMNPIPTSKSTNMNIQEVVEDEEDEDDAIMGVQDAEPEEMTIENSIPISTPTQLLTNKETKDVTMDDFMQSPSITAPVIATEETLSILHPDVLIVESTYGVQVHASRTEREARFTSTVERIVTRGGNCLIPVFALGRAQELLLILDEYWQQHSHLQNIPIWYASKLASRALRVYQTYANMMNARIRAQMDIGNPFAFQYIRNLKSIDSIYHTADSNTSELVVFDDRNNANVVFASPGMLQSGVSRRLFDRWASDPKNGVIVAGYAVEHTLAKEILNGPKEVVTLEGKRQPLACLVDYISFSAHVDFMQNRTFITKVHPKHIILVHGSKEEMGRLKGALMLQFRQWPENKRPTVTMPPNLQEVKLEFARRRSAKVIGSLVYQAQSSGTSAMNEATQTRVGLPQEGDAIQGILVTQNHSSKIVSPDDLATYTPLRVGSVSSTLHVPFVTATTLEGKSVYVDTFRFLLNEMFSGVVESSYPLASYRTEDANLGFVEAEQDEDMDRRDESTNATQSRAGFRVIVFSLLNNDVTVSIGKTVGIATLEWNASPLNDIVADSIVALLMHTQSSASSIRTTSQPCGHSQRRRRKRGDALQSNQVGEVGTLEKKDNRNENDKDKDDSLDTEEKRLKKQKSSLLRLCYQALMESYAHVDAIFDVSMATFEIRLDGQASSSSQPSGSNIKYSAEENLSSEESSSICTVKVIFEADKSLDAKISVECVDGKLAAVIQDCLRNVAIAAAPITFPA